MANESLTAEQELKRLSESLGLQYEQQDWGIVNADRMRLGEFIAYYEAHPELTTTQRFELGELILASTNELLLSGDRSVPATLPEFLARNRQTLHAQLEYWSGLEDLTEFPLSHWLKVHFRAPP